MAEGARLENHRIRRNMALVGWPIYDDDDMFVGTVTEPEWPWSGLTSAEQSVVQSLADRIEERGTSKDLAFSYALSEYAIECPHQWRSEGLRPWLECRYCHLTRERPGQPVRVEGRDDMWVEHPPPPRLKLPRPNVISALTDPSPSVMPTIEVDEYRWTGSRYVPVGKSENGPQR